ncbi:hypothetical protein N5P18_15480 [Janibacter terrae]|uniref:YtxH domain-containing protein n=1 Tax=Janibacter terrae TaxID=103817 RepID=A0ABZ2FFQ0_9MICO
MGKITMLAAGAVGYVLGTRAGREQYDKLSTQAKRVWRDPKVQRKAGQAQEAAVGLGHKAEEKVTSKVKEHTGGDSSGTTTSPTPGTGTMGVGDVHRPTTGSDTPGGGTFA